MSKQLVNIGNDFLIKPDKKIKFSLEIHKKRGGKEGYKPDGYGCGYKEMFAWTSELYKFSDEKCSINSKIGLVYNIPVLTDRLKETEQNQSWIYLLNTVQILSDDFHLNIGKPLSEGYFFLGSFLSGTISKFNGEGFKLDFYQRLNGRLQLQMGVAEEIKEENGILETRDCWSGPPLRMSPNSLDEITPNGKLFCDYLKELFLCIDFYQEKPNDLNKKFLVKEKKALDKFMKIYNKFLETSEKKPVSPSNEY